MSTLVTRPATDLIRLVAAGEISAAALVRLHLDRIASTAPALNAFVDVCADAAIADAARQDDQATRGVPRGPLGGLPVTVKSAIEVAGLRCEAGSPTRAGAIAARAAAIATGCSAAGIGSDGGGSMRVPAHFTGICGFKPAPGRLPATGHQPPCLGPFSLIGVVGPMARTVADLALLDRALAGWDAGDPMSIPFAPESPALPAIRGTRVAWFTDSGDTPVTAETRAAVRAVAASLAEAGACSTSIVRLSWRRLGHCGIRSSPRSRSWSSTTKWAVASASCRSFARISTGVPCRRH